MVIACRTQRPVVAPGNQGVLVGYHKFVMHMVRSGVHFHREPSLGQLFDI